MIDYSKPLKNLKHERFCQEFIIDNNKTQAAIRAKYSRKTGKTKGEQLSKIVEIKERIVYLQSQLSEETGITAKMVIDEFAKIAFAKISKKIKCSDKVKALENLGKHLGIYEIDNKQKEIRFIINQY